MKNIDERDFDLGTTLSITTGRVLTNFNNIQDALEYLTNDEVYTHQIPRAIGMISVYVLSKYPQLNGVGKNENFDSGAELYKFLEEQKKIYGNSFKLSPMPENMYQHIDAIEELQKIISKKRR